MVVGGSISRYYAGNFGQFLQHGCSALEVVNLGETGASAAKMHRNFKVQLDDPQFAEQLPRGHSWLISAGGLNSVWLPHWTARWLSRLNLLAKSRGMGTIGLTLTPWGSEDDPRFAGWKGLRLHRATEQVVDFMLGKLTPAAALGETAAGQAEWAAGELPDIAVDLWRSDLRAGQEAVLRDRETFAQSFASSPFRRQRDDFDLLVAAAVAVPRQFLAKKFHDFDSTHPNTAGHRLIAALVCQKAPPSWQCDCEKIRRAQWRGGRVASP